MDGPYPAVVRFSLLACGPTVADSASPNPNTQSPQTRDRRTNAAPFPVMARPIMDKLASSGTSASTASVAHMRSAKRSGQARCYSSAFCRNWKATTPIFSSLPSPPLCPPRTRSLRCNDGTSCGRCSFGIALRLLSKSGPRMPIAPVPTGSLEPPGRYEGSAEPGLRHRPVTSARASLRYGAGRTFPQTRLSKLEHHVGMRAGATAAIARPRRAFDLLAQTTTQMSGPSPRTSLEQTCVGSTDEWI
jgi:hypothetical protein